MSCSGNTDEHCCTFRFGGDCKYIEENTVPGRRWACGLMRELGDWDKVITSDRYRKDVEPKWRGTYLTRVDLNCRDWPIAPMTCDCRDD